MASQLRRIRSELPSGDPTLMNRVAWARRWSDRQASVDYALSARKTAIAGTGKRSRAEQGMALRTLAWQARWRGALDDAMGHCLSAETFLPESDHVEARAGIYSILGIVHFSRSRLDLANCSVERGFWLLRDVPDTSVQEVMTDLLLTRATIQRHSGEKARAGITLGRAHELAIGEIANSVDYCTASWLLADGDVEAAQSRALDTLESAKSHGNRVILPYLQCVLGACEAKLGHSDAAVEHIKLGLTIAEADEDMRAQCFLLREYARMECDGGNTEQALTHLRKAADIAKATGFAFERKRIALDLAALLEKMGQYKQSVDQHKLAWRLQSETRVR